MSSETPPNKPPTASAIPPPDLSWVATLLGFLGLSLSYYGNFFGLAPPRASLLLLVSLSVFCVGVILHIVRFSQKGPYYAAAGAVGITILVGAPLYIVLGSPSPQDLIAAITQGDARTIWAAGLLVLVLVLALGTRRLIHIRIISPPLDRPDEINRKILTLLQQEGPLTDEQLSEKLERRVGPRACRERIKLLRERNYLRGPYYMLQSQHLQRLGVGHLCFITVKLKDTSVEIINEFQNFAKDDKRILEIHSLPLGADADAHDYIMKVRLSDRTDVRRMAGRFEPFITDLTTFDVVQTIQERTAIDLTYKDEVPVQDALSARPRFASRFFPFSFLARG